VRATSQAQRPSDRNQGNTQKKEKEPDPWSGNEKRGVTGPISFNRKGSGVKRASGRSFHGRVFNMTYPKALTGKGRLVEQSGPTEKKNKIDIKARLMRIFG